MTRRCPFLAAIAAGDAAEATRVARAGPDPADVATIPVLIVWAQDHLDREAMVADIDRLAELDADT